MDVSRESLDSLVSLILQHESILVGQSGPASGAAAPDGTVGGVPPDAQGAANHITPREMQAVVTLAAVNVLANQIYQLLRGATPFQVRGRQQLLRCVVSRDFFVSG